MQTPVKQSLFCVCINFILLCANIIPEAIDTVKKTTGVYKSASVTLLAKKVLRCNGFMAPKCVTRIAVAVFLVCDKIFLKK